MISIYHAANLADAHLIRQLLEQERIRAHIAGEYLQGALGEIPANTPIEVRVAAEDAVRARQIVEAWEHAPIDQAWFDEEDDTAATSSVPADTMNSGRARSGSLSAVAWLLGGAAIGAGLMWAAHHGPEKSAEIDFDQNGVVDERGVYVAERLRRIESDRNQDRKIDQITHYDSQGDAERYGRDRDFDGRFDEQGRYARGQVSSVTVDEDRDDRPDYRADYVLGVIFREEWLDPNGDVIKRVEYRGGNPVAGAFDGDGDGRLDVERVYDTRGEIVQTRPLLPH
jgi:Putative prokaryotic signal transducing protein